MQNSTESFASRLQEFFISPLQILKLEVIVSLKFCMDTLEHYIFLFFFN